MLNDKNIAHEIRTALGEKAKSGFLTAADVVEVVSSPGIQEQLAQVGIFRPSIPKTNGLPLVKEAGVAAWQAPNWHVR